MFSTECQNICSPLSPLDDIYALAGDLAESNCVGEDCAALQVSVDIQILGSPCAESDTIERGDVALDLHVCGAQGQYEAHANDDLCAKLTPSDFGDSTLSVISEELVKRDPNGGEVTIVHPFFSGVSISPGNGVVSDNSPLDLQLDDAFHTYTLTVFWEQKIAGARRLLRTTHVFGAGDHESKSSITILPASAQIEDAAGSLDAKSEEAAPKEEEKEEDSGLSDLEIGLIAGGSALVVLGAGYMIWKREKDGYSRMDSLGEPRYSAVRRSERFSTNMNF